MWHLFVETELRALLGVPDEVALSAVHHTRPAARIARPGTRRAPLADLVFDGRWGETAAWATDPPGDALQRPTPLTPTHRVPKACS